MHRAFAAALLFVTSLAAVQAHAANTWGTDFSDVWWNPAESGWGANVQHQGEVAFMTLFVYGSDGTARWYIAPNMPSSSASFPVLFTGAFYQTNGPYFGSGAFDPAAVGARQVGTATLTFASATLGALTYTVDGVTVTKSVQRQSWRTNNLAGVYVGGLSTTGAGCSDNSAAISSDLITITQSGTNGSTMSVVFASNAGSCTMNGSYAQLGRMGTFGGSISCSNGASGSVVISEMETSTSGIMAKFNANYGGGCTDNGRIAGVKE